MGSNGKRKRDVEFFYDLHEDDELLEDSSQLPSKLPGLREVIKELAATRDDFYLSLGIKPELKRQKDRNNVLCYIAALEKATTFGIQNQSGYIPGWDGRIFGIIKIDNVIIEKAKKAHSLFNKAIEILYPFLIKLSRSLAYRYRLYESDVLSELQVECMKALDQIKPKSEKTILYYLERWLSRHIARKRNELGRDPLVEISLDDPIDQNSGDRIYADVIADPDNMRADEILEAVESIRETSQEKFFAINNMKRINVLFAT